jgi:uncharacterized RDD family membrane protein YckC
MTMPQGEVPVTPGKADLAKRFLAALIDGVLCAVLALVPVLGALAGAAYVLVRDGLDVEFMKRRSIGKHVMKLRPVRLDGQSMDIPTSVRRNFLFVIGLVGLPFYIIPVIGWGLAALLGGVQIVISIVEIVLVLTDPEGRRMGDKFAGTRIVESEA